MGEKMKTPKVCRPEIEIEYKGVFGFLYAMVCIIRIGIKRVRVDVTMCNEEVVAKQKFWIIPKYKIAKQINLQGGVKEVEKSENE